MYKDLYTESYNTLFKETEDLKSMEEYTISMGYKTQYYKTVYSL